MADNNNIICYEEGGVQYFTLIGTGQSGLSTSGIAKSLGVNPSSITRLVELIMTSVLRESLPESLQSLWGRQLQFCAKYKNIKIYTSDAWSCFAEYYAFEAQKKTKEALTTYRAFARIGAESYIQGKTNWLPKDKQSAKESRSILDIIITPYAKKKEGVHFDENWRLIACNLTGYNWEGLPMAKFIRRAVYDWFPVKLIERLVGVNPYVDARPGRRQHCHYQHFCQEIDESVLKMHIRDVYNSMCLAQSQQHFWQLMKNRFSRGLQMDLLQE